MANRFDMLPHIAPRYKLRAGYFETGEWEHRSLGAAFTAAAAARPDQAWIFRLAGQDVARSMGELALRARDFALRLRADTTADEDTVVAIVLPNAPAAVTAFYGGALAGMVLFPISMREQRDTLADLLRLVGARHIVVATDDADRQAWAEEYRVAGLLDRVWLGDQTGAVGADGEAPVPDGEIPVVSDGVHLITYTSGSTSVPKIVLYTDAQLMNETAGLNEVFRFFGPVLVPSPVGHITGILHLLTLPLIRPHTVVSMDRWDAGQAVELCRQHGCETLAGTSLYFQEMHRVSPELGGLRGGIAGGGPVTPGLVRTLDMAGIQLVRAYGSTEHPTITQSLPIDPVEVRSMTDGRPVGSSVIRLVDENGREVPVGEPGEIISRGPDAMAGYLDAELDAEYYTEDGWFRTGDVGILDTNGYVTISDRIKDIIIRGGENISAKEVEDVLDLWDAVVEVSVVGVPDADYGERSCAFIIPADPVADLSVDDLRAYLAGTRLEKFKWPEYVEALAEFPRTASGKVRKQTLRDQWQAAGTVGSR